MTSALVTFWLHVVTLWLHSGYVLTHAERSYVLVWLRFDLYPLEHPAEGMRFPLQSWYSAINSYMLTSSGYNEGDFGHIIDGFETVYAISI